MQGPGVGVEDDLGEAGDDEAEVCAGVLCDHHGGLLPLQALGHQAGEVEDVPHVAQPSTAAQPRQPLVRQQT